MMANNTRNAQAVAGVAAVLAAAALAVPHIAGFEGWKNVGYRDPAPAGYATICAGHRQDGVVGEVMTNDQCAGLLAQDAVKAGLDIAPCLPAELPSSTRAAFISFAFNVGSPRFCTSGVARYAKAGNLKAACAELSNWKYAGGVVLPGLVVRRADERKLCESGLK